MQYSQALDYLFGSLPMFQRIGAAAYKPGLERVQWLDEVLGHPHQTFATIHIAGTNGKGSVSHLIAASLQAQGYKVGLYTSPHLVDFRERIRVNGNMIPRGAVADFVEQYAVEPGPDSPSFFELTMGMAFDFFARSNVDIAVIETGMGGRLDSTNIITPLLSVITNVSYDHTQFLGRTLPEIAFEKAGIIKKNVPVVIGERHAETAPVFEKKAKEMDAPLIFASDNPFAFNVEREKRTGMWHITHPLGIEARCPLGGDYQAHNILTALHALARLESHPTSPEAIARGFSRVCEMTGLMGRWMQTSEEPVIICDTGHNIAGIESNSAQLQNWQLLHPECQLHVILGFVSDKDVDHILPLLPAGALYYFTQASVPRAMPVEMLADLAARNGIQGLLSGSVPEAVDQALSSAAPQDLIFIGGSTFVVADYLASLQ